MDVSPQQAAGFYKDYVSNGIAGNDVSNYSQNSHSQNTHYFNKYNSIIIILIIGNKEKKMINI